MGSVWPHLYRLAPSSTAEQHHQSHHRKCAEVAWQLLRYAMVYPPTGRLILADFYVLPIGVGVWVIISVIYHHIGFLSLLLSGFNRFGFSRFGFNRLDCLIVYNCLISASTTYSSPLPTVQPRAAQPLVGGHLFCHFEVAAHIVGKLFRAHLRLLQSGCYFPHLAEHCLFVEFVQECHGSWGVLR